MIIFFTGLSGSGKTQYANYLKENHGFLVINGDEMRKTISKDLVFSNSDKIENGRRMIELAKLFHTQKDIVVDTIMGYNGDENAGRVMTKLALSEYDYRLVWVKASLDTCILRDTKGLYASNTPELVGLTSKWEDPIEYDLVLDTENNSYSTNCQKLSDWLKAGRI